LADRILRTLTSPRLHRNALLILIWVGILGIVVAIREVLLPFVIAVAIAYVIEPAVRRISAIEVRGRKVPRWGAVVAIYLAFFAVVWALLAFFVPQLYREVAGIARDGTELVQSFDEQKVEDLSRKVEEYTKRMRLPVRIETRAELPTAVATGDVPEEVDILTGVPVEEVPLAGLPAVLPDEEEEQEAIFTLDLPAITRGVVESATGVFHAQTSLIVRRLQVVVGGLVNLLFSTVLVLMICAFISMDTDRIKRFVFSIIPFEDRDSFDRFLDRVDRGLSGVVRGQLTICFVNGMLTLVGLLLLGVKFAFILATVAMVFSLIPIFGSILSTIPIVMVALASGVFTALLSLGWVVLIHFLEANFLNPKIMGDAAKIHPVVIVLALVSGEHFYGLAGALFAVPLASFILTVVRSILSRVERLERASRRKVPVSQSKLSQRHMWREPRP